MLYNLELPNVKIVDYDYFLSVTNKITGETVTAKNHCGRVNRKLYFSMRYDTKESNVSHQECGKQNAVAFALKYLGLPTYNTLKRQQKALTELNN